MFFDDWPTLARTMLVAPVAYLALLVEGVRLGKGIAFLSTRVPALQHLVKARPTLLVRNGALLEKALRDQRVARSEVLQVARQHGPGIVGGGGGGRAGDRRHHERRQAGPAGGRAVHAGRRRRGA